jgi:hypothetical protein
MSEKPMAELARWDSPARHQFGALVTACAKLRAASAEHDRVDKWLRSARERGPANVPVSEGNEWTGRDYDASDAMGAAILEILQVMDSLGHRPYRSRAEMGELFDGPPPEPPPGIVEFPK